MTDLMKQPFRVLCFVLLALFAAPQLHAAAVPAKTTSQLEGGVRGGVKGKKTTAKKQKKKFRPFAFLKNLKFKKDTPTTVQADTQTQMQDRRLLLISLILVLAGLVFTILFSGTLNALGALALALGLIGLIVYLVLMVV